MAEAGPWIFLPYAGDDAFEASLLQYAVEHLLDDLHARVWTYQRDQAHDQKAIAASIKRQIRQSRALIFMVSPRTLDFGATQWMELAYADAFDIPIFVLLSHLTYAELREHEKGVPPLLLQSQCNNATNWQTVVNQVRARMSAPPLTTCTGTVMSNIFISHVSADAPRIDGIKRELRRRGIVQDDDQFIDPAHVTAHGACLRDALRKEIEAASMVVVLWGPEASSSANVSYETGMADALDKPIVLVVPEGEVSRPRIGSADLRVVEMHA